MPELVPSSSWFTNLRSMLSKEIWDIVRKEVYRNAGMRCEICRGRGEKHPVECHEVWEYNEAKCVQKLVRLIALCPACHEVKHIGLAELKGRLEQAMEHMCRVNGITMEKGQEIHAKAIDDFERRSGIGWDVDITYLDKFVKELDIRIVNKGNKWIAE